MKRLTLNFSLFVSKSKQAISKVMSLIKANKHNKMIMMLLVCGLFFTAIFGYKIFGKVMMNRYFNNMPIPVAIITSAEVKFCSWSKSIQSVGSVHAVNSVDVTTEAAGVVDVIKFESGDKVNKEDVLLELNTKADKARLASASAAMQLAKQNLVRAERLSKAGNISAAELDTRQTQAIEAASSFALQQELIAQKIIRAPFAGLLGIRKINLGEYLAPGRAIVSLQSLDPIFVNFSVPEQELYNLTIGLPVYIQVEALPDKVFTGKLTAIEPGADPATRNFNVQATFANQDLKLRPGMFAEITINLPGNEKVVAIPRSAVSYNPYGNSVYVLQKIDAAQAADAATVFKVKQRFIKLGDEQGEMVVVLDGLTKGEILATSGLLKLRNDATVQVNNTILPSVNTHANKIH